MNEAEVQKRLEEERSESAGWAEVLANFSQGYFSKLHCPHCGADRQFEYLTHANGFTIRCRACERFIHGSGGIPHWLDDGSSAFDEYRPVPQADCDGEEAECAE